MTVPRTLHRIWLGPAPIPRDAERYWSAFRRMHPDWKTRTWTDGDDYSWLENRELFRSATTWTSRSDVLRFELLARFGGVYVDVDVEPLRRLDPLLRLGAFAGREDERAICGAVMGAEAGHPAVRALVEALPSWTRGRPSAAPHAWAGPSYLTAMWDGREDVELLPREAFYPIHWRSRNVRPTRYPEGSYAVHHWARNWARADEPSVSIAMCWTDRGDVWRREVKDWVERYWRAAFPGAEFVVGSDGGGATFNRSAALNDAASRASGDVLVFVDADCAIPGEIVTQAARLVHGARVWAVPWYTNFRLTREATEAILARDPETYRPAMPPRANYSGRELGIGLRFGGFCEVLPRGAFETVGGWPEAFEGWGSEDIGMTLALDTLWGPHYVPKTHALHLYHDRPSLQTENAGLELDYWRAFGDSEAMRELLGTGREPAPGPTPPLPSGWVSSDSMRRVPRTIPPERRRLEALV